MSDQAVLKGRRVSERIWSDDEQRQPGDYYRHLHGGWAVCDPNGDTYALPGHTVEEHADEKITVRPSIVAPRRDGFHGYLEHGIWRSV